MLADLAKRATPDATWANVGDPLAAPGGGDQPEPRQQTRTYKFVWDNKNSVCPNLVPSCVPILSRAFGTALGNADKAL